MNSSVEPLDLMSTMSNGHSKIALKYISHTA